MKWKERAAILLVILFPLVIAVALPFSPRSAGYFEASQAVKQAVLEGDLQEELDNLLRLLVYTPWRGDKWIQAGRLQLTVGKYVEAVDSFKTAKRLGQLHAQGQVWLADALLEMGENEQAASELKEINFTSDETVLLQTAALQEEMQDFDAAVVTLRTAQKQDPSNIEANYQLGLLLAVTEPEEALFYLGWVKTTDARSSVANAISAAIEDTADIAGTGERSMYIGQVLSRFEEWGAAVRAFETAVKQLPKSANAWALLAEAQQQNGLDGYAALEEALKLDDESELVNGLAAMYYRREGKTELAMQYLSKAITANPEATVWEIEMGNTLAAQGKLEDALKHYQAATTIDEQDWVAWKALATFCVLHNYQVESAGLDAIRRALLLYPDSPPLLDLMGTVYMIMGDLDSGERFFLQAEKLDPNQAAVLIHLGQLNIYKGEKQKAFEYFRQAARVAQESRLRDMANRLLVENGGQ